MLPSRLGREIALISFESKEISILVWSRDVSKDKLSSRRIITRASKLQVDLSRRRRSTDSLLRNGPCPLRQRTLARPLFVFSFWPSALWESLPNCRLAESC